MSILKRLSDRMPTASCRCPRRKITEALTLIGESLVGEGNEVAHIDLMIGDKDGPVGQAFANGMTSLSAGHTPLLAVIRPNLPPKPHTLIVPKVTVKNMEDTGKIFGPAQAAVAKAIADSAEEGIIPRRQTRRMGNNLQRFHSPESNRLPKNIPVQLWRNKNGAPTSIKELPIAGKDNLRKRPFKAPNHGLQSSTPMETTISANCT